MKVLALLISQLTKVRMPLTQLEQVVNTYHLDGIDFDDEYAEYGKNGTPQPNNSSFIWLLQSLKKSLRQ